MKKHTSLSRSLNQSEGFELMENYYLSGLRPIEYYNRHGISKPQFYYWRKRYSDAHPQETPAECITIDHDSLLFHKKHIPL